MFGKHLCMVGFVSVYVLFLCVRCEKIEHTDKRGNPIIAKNNALMWRLYMHGLWCGVYSRGASRAAQSHGVAPQYRCFLSVLASPPPSPYDVLSRR